MDNQEFQKFIGTLGLTVAEAMRKIDVNSFGILFLIDEQRKLRYSLTDGDVRRFLLAGGNLDDNVRKAANPKPRYARSFEEATALYDNKSFIAIPICNDDGEMIDLYIGKMPAKTQRSSLHIPVVINAGGKGTRLDPYTRVLPKPLIPVGDYPIIEHIMKEYQSYSCDQFHIIVNYKRELMKAYFSENEAHYHIHWYDEEKPLGTGGGLSFLRGKIDSTFFFTNCDNLLLANYERILQFHRKHQNVITMICAYKYYPIPYGVIEMGINGKIEKIREKPVISVLANTGIYVVEPEVLEDIEDDVAIGFPEIVEKQRQKGRKVSVFPVSESEWLDMGQLSELEKMRKRLYGE